MSDLGPLNNCSLRTKAEFYQASWTSTCPLPREGTGVPLGNLCLRLAQSSAVALWDTETEDLTSSAYILTAETLR